MPTSVCEDDGVMPLMMGGIKATEGGGASPIQSESADSGGDDTEGRRKRAKPVSDNSKARKPTYLQQKEERDVLTEEIRRLEAVVDKLRFRVGLPTSQDREIVENILSMNASIEEHIHSNRLNISRLQSLVSNELMSVPVNPMSTFIHMPLHLHERRTLLLAMKDMKLRRAVELATERLHFIDPFKSYIHEEKFRKPNGRFHCHRFDVEPFYGLQSARQLFDLLHYFLSNLETNVEQMLGQLAIREDSDDVDASIWNHRLVTTVPDVGVPEELNTVAFCRYYDHYPPHGGASFGVFAYDTVDVDELYPYKPHERTRKDVQSAYTISEYIKPDTRELVVVLKRCVYIVQHPPAFSVAPGVVERLVDNMPRWLVLMIKFLRAHTPPSGAIGMR